MEYGNELQEAKKAVSQLEEKQKSQQDTLRKNEDTYIGYVTTIENYEGIVGAIASGEADQLEEASLRALNSFITAESGTKESLEKQVAHMKKNYEELKKAVEDGAPGVTKESVKEMKKLVDLSEKELAKFEGKARKQGEKGGKAYGSGTASKEGDAKTAGNRLAAAASVAMGAADTANVGAQVGLKYSSGISGKKGNSQNAGKISSPRLQRCNGRSGCSKCQSAGGNEIFFWNFQQERKFPKRRKFDCYGCPGRSECR